MEVEKKESLPKTAQGERPKAIGSVYISYLVRLSVILVLNYRKLTRRLQWLHPVVKTPFFGLNVCRRTPVSIKRSLQSRTSYFAEPRYGEPGHREALKDYHWQEVARTATSRPCSIRIRTRSMPSYIYCSHAGTSDRSSRSPRKSSQARLASLVTNPILDASITHDMFSQLVAPRTCV